MVLRAATAEDMPAVRSLLERDGLPTSDLGTSDAEFIIAQDGAAVIAAGAVERIGQIGLLRSVVVAPDQRRSGTGMAIVAELERRARDANLTELVLLTESAQSFFEGRGYVVISRAGAPLEVQGSEEFRALCPDSAICMSKRLV